VSAEAVVLVNQTLGMPLDRSPFLAEQVAIEAANELKVAIEATNGLKSAEVVLRHLRGRSLLGRLWEMGTGTGDARVAEAGGHQLAAQRATLNLVQALMEEQSRTQYCVKRVLTNLLGVNRDLDDLADRVEEHEQGFSALREGLRCLERDLHDRVAKVEFGLKRMEAVQHLTNLAMVGALHPGAGQLLGPALYLAARQRYYSDEPLAARQAKWQEGLEVVKGMLPGKPAPTSELIRQAADQVRPECAEAVLFLTQGDSGPTTAAVGTLLKCRQQPPGGGSTNALEVFLVERRKCASEHSVAHLLRPYELAAYAAGELLGLTLGADPWRLKRLP
jgi:hypothetical protein